MSAPAIGSHDSASEEGLVRRFFNATEIDPRMLGMVGALLVIWAGFDIYSGILRPSDGLFGGSFLSPRNLWILMVQTASIAIMATGMVLIIVMLQIDISVGSMLSIISVSFGYLQFYILGPTHGV
jgi:D-xylose transport system permease protein